MGVRAILMGILMLVLGSSMAFGASFFNTGITALSNQISMNESAEFALVVYSSSNRIETFSLYTDVEWSMATIPSEDRNLRIYPNSNKETIVQIKPKSEARIFPGAHSVRIYLKNTLTGEVITNTVILHIRGEGDSLQDYLPSIRAEARINPRIDPREPVQLTLKIENQNIADIESLRVFISSDLFSIQDLLSISPLESKEVGYTAYIDDKQPPVEDLVRVNLKTDLDGRIYEFNSVPIRYEVISYGGIEETSTVEKSFLKRTTTYRMVNTGNTDRTHEFVLKRNFILAPFTAFDQSPEIKNIDGKKHYTWSADVPIGSFHVYEGRVNYRPLAAIILIAAALLVLFYVYRSPILISKSMVVTSQKHGGIAGITVQIDIKNRSDKPIADLKIRDKVPSMFALQKVFDIGTLHPTQILKHEKKGTIIKWNIDDLEAFEERILTYRLVSRLNIIGKFTLPRASLTFSSGKTSKIIHSNKVLMTHKTN